MDTAEAILSTVGARQATWQTGLAAKLRASEDIGNSFGEMASHLGDLPTLLKQGKEEREQRELNQAALGGYLTGGADGMEHAALAHGATTLGGQSTLFGIIARRAAMRDHGIKLANEERTLAHQKAQSEAMKGLYEPVLEQPQQSPQSPMMSMMGGVPEPNPTLGPVRSMRPPTGDERLQRLSRAPGLMLSDLTPFMADDRTRDLAAERDTAKRESDAAKAEAHIADQKHQEAMKALDQTNRLALLKERAGFTDKRVDTGRTFKHTEAELQRTWQEGQNKLNRDQRQTAAEQAQTTRDNHEAFFEWLSEAEQNANVDEAERKNALAQIQGAKTGIANKRLAIRAKLAEDSDADVTQLKTDLDEYEDSLNKAEKRISAITKAVVPPPPEGISIKQNKKGNAGAVDAFRATLTPDGQKDYDSLNDADKATYRKMHGGI